MLSTMANEQPPQTLMQSTGYLSLIEVARKQPSLSVLWKIANGLEWRFSELALHVERRYELEQRVRKRSSKAQSGDVPRMRKKT